MRVIAGKFKGRKLFSPLNKKVRPTSDRVKETIFNILYSNFKIAGEDALDLFCGSGSLGIEALSRGANSAVFCDKSSDSIMQTRENLINIKAESYETYVADYSLALKKLQGREFGVIFLDPPYKDNLEKATIQAILDRGVLKAGGVIVLEHSKDYSFDKIFDTLDCDTRQMGNTCVSFFALKKAEE